MREMPRPRVPIYDSKQRVRAELDAEKELVYFLIGEPTDDECARCQFVLTRDEAAAARMALGMAVDAIDKRRTATPDPR